ncbi:MAG: orotidine-5'-phosphate decarboxylase [Thermodesulforhabdaceae bacterium]
MKAISPQDRLILALDVPTREDALDVVKKLEGSVRFFKIGLQLFLSSHFYLVDWLGDRGYKVFLDLKLYDIPNTVVQALSVMSMHPVTFTTLHAEKSILKAAVEAVSDRIGILAVTVLTSMEPEAFKVEHGKTVEEAVLHRALMAKDAGCAGVIASGAETALIRQHCGEEFLIINPGIRPRSYQAKDDQKRTVTAYEAIRNGADYIVVGRPILKAPDIRTAAMEMLREIEEACALGKA